MKKTDFIIGLFWIVLVCAGSGPSPLRAEIPIPESPLSQASLMAFNSIPEERNLEPEADAAMPVTGPRKISKAKAIFLSVLAPGAGHLYMGEKGRGEVFLGAEVVSWAGFFAFRTAGKWKKEDYINYAEKYAGIDPDGKDDDFYRNLTFYNSTEEYNESGRIINPGSPYYYPETGYDWQWVSDEARADYRDMRNSSESYYRNATFMIGVAVVNRIFASIDAIRLLRKHTGSGHAEYGEVKKLDFKVKANPFGHNPEVKLTVLHRF
nr:hypothetical protein [candidate division Zixibacteria bacterium]